MESQLETPASHDQNPAAEGGGGGFDPSARHSRRTLPLPVPPPPLPVTPKRQLVNSPFLSIAFVQDGARRRPILCLAHPQTRTLERLPRDWVAQYVNRGKV